MEDEKKALLTTLELAEHLRVSTETVKAWARDRRIPAFRLGRNTLRFDLAEVIEALRDNRSTEGGQHV